MIWGGSLAATAELAVVAGVGVVVGWWLRRSLGSRPSNPAASELAPPRAVESPARADVLAPPRTSRIPLSGPDPTPPGPDLQVTGVPGADGYGLARRVLVHLSRHGHVPPGEVAPVAFTQRGMAEALEVRQGNLAKVLQRLRAAGAIEVDRRHVVGMDRRVNVYSLTPLGASVARSLRGADRTGMGSPSGPPAARS